MSHRQEHEQRPCGGAGLWGPGSQDLPIPSAGQVTALHDRPVHPLVGGVGTPPTLRPTPRNSLRPGAWGSVWGQGGRLPGDPHLQRSTASNSNGSSLARTRQVAGWEALPPMAASPPPGSRVSCHWGGHLCPCLRDLSPGGLLGSLEHSSFLREVWAFPCLPVRVCPRG